MYLSVSYKDVLCSLCTSGYRSSDNFELFSDSVRKNFLCTYTHCQGHKAKQGHKSHPNYHLGIYHSSSNRKLKQSQGQQLN